MSEYKRLTNKNLDYEFEFCKTCGNYQEIGGMEWQCDKDSCKEKDIFMQITDRLAELEDKIKSGLGFIVPCNVGDTVWYLNTTPSMTLARNTIYEGKLVRYHILNYPQPLGTCVLADIQIHNEYGTTEVPDVKGFGKIWFIDKSQAEARLKELKGEK